MRSSSAIPAVTARDHRAAHDGAARVAAARRRGRRCPPRCSTGSTRSSRPASTSTRPTAAGRTRRLSRRPAAGGSPRRWAPMRDAGAWGARPNNSPLGSGSRASGDLLGPGASFATLGAGAASSGELFGLRERGVGVAPAWVISARARPSADGECSFTHVWGHIACSAAGVCRVWGCALIRRPASSRDTVIAFGPASSGGRPGPVAVPGATAQRTIVRNLDRRWKRDVRRDVHSVSTALRRAERCWTRIGVRS